LKAAESSGGGLEREEKRRGVPGLRKWKEAGDLSPEICAAFGGKTTLRRSSNRKGAFSREIRGETEEGRNCGGEERVLGKTAALREFQG